MTNEIKVGIIGSGGIAKVHAIAYSKINFVKIVAVSDVIKERAETLAKAFNARAYTSYEKMIKENDLEIVSVCTPPFTHRDIVLDVIKSNINIICEKPLALNSREAKEMVGEAERRGLYFGVDFQNRLLPQHIKAKELLSEGAIGKLIQARFRVGYDILEAVPPSAPMREWLFDKSKSGGGVLMDIGSHWIDLSRMFVGSEAESVSAEISKNIENIEVEDNAMVLIRFKNSVHALVDVSWTQQNGQWPVELYGDQGTILCNFGEQTIVLYTKNKKYSKDGKLKVITPSLPEIGEPHEYLIGLFVNSIVNKTQPPVTGYDGYKAQEIIDAAYKSASEKVKVVI
ncbi:MAG: Gfo/Idh/MocA family oxidoreductase [Thermoproteota archaeon]|nr:Gfo/Idh/MocA family oxidoreductase [Candidatus Brockarchaeota archaeon]MBO3763280.1 Gfo/Idh/MocA family oxidoreductase [Candidatus Brockarchaeota archaeon]MBO3768389.1 Gfo/Idh/MocA family oxidoreductase [Candidatus Brockarchaeota archaeon]MBO3802237.1 Gfo/Idh/MocA family oxidoreductase [Candidatus Brockarchaeota archaeon]